MDFACVTMCLIFINIGGGVNVENMYKFAKNI